MDIALGNVARYWTQSPCTDGKNRKYICYGV